MEPQLFYSPSKSIKENFLFFFFFFGVGGVPSHLLDSFWFF
jgi:hypothetical protein